MTAILGLPRTTDPSLPKPVRNRCKEPNVQPYQLALNLQGVHETPGLFENNPKIMEFLTADHTWPENDEVPWCSAFVNYCCKLARYERSKSLLARSWLKVGLPLPRWGALGLLVNGDPAIPSLSRNDIVILQRGSGNFHPDNTTDPGHVGFFYGWGTDDEGNPDYNWVKILGGNQSDAVSIMLYPSYRILGIRRLRSLKQIELAEAAE